MSLDVSPNGGTLVFDLLGVYTLPLEGGEAKRIVGGMSFESQPRFSPDGKTIAFLSCFREQAATRCHRSNPLNPLNSPVEQSTA